MRRPQGKLAIGWRRGLTVGALTFFVALVLSLPARGAISHLDLPLAILVLLLIVFIGVLFDAIGIAAAAAEESPFNAMAAANVPGGRQALWIVRNADAVTSFCNDMVGDVAGTLSGAVGIAIVFQLLARRPDWDEAALSMLVVALTSALTVGGKAAFKALAIEQARSIVYAAGRILYVLERAGLITLRVRRNHQARRSRP